MYRSNISASESKLTRKPLQRQERNVKPAQGTINTAGLDAADFSETTMTQYVSGHNGRNNPVASGRRYPAMATTEFAESTLSQHYDQATSQIKVPKQAKALWRMCSNHLCVPGGKYTPAQADAINRFIRSTENQAAAMELEMLRNSDYPLTSKQQSRRYELERALATSLTYLTKVLRSE